MVMGSGPAAVDGDDPLVIADGMKAGLDLSKIEKFARLRGDALFGYIERCQVEAFYASGDGDGVPCFGDFLDAGTGSHSLRWMASVLHRERLLADGAAVGEGGGERAPMVSMRSFTAVTADEAMRRRVLDEATGLGVADKGDIIIGNWMQQGDDDEEGDNTEALLGGRKFDTILADYLVGAIDGFSPYFQDRIFSRLRRHLAPGGRMYVIGLQPIPDSVPGDGNVFCKITKVRDACILLANHRCYREYPLDWIERHLERAGLRTVESKKYPIRYDHGTMLRQINVARSKLKLFPSKELATEMGKVLDGLERESLVATRRQEGGRLMLGFDYVVVAEMPIEGAG